MGEMVSTIFEVELSIASTPKSFINAAQMSVIFCREVFAAAKIRADIPSRRSLGAALLSMQ